MNKNYYDILGITDEEKKLKGEEFEKIAKAKYRKIALEAHPDRQVGKSEAEKKKAEKRFKEASEAYETLSDATKRDEYDNPHSQFEFKGGMDFGGMNMDEIFRHFGFGGFGDNLRPQQQVIRGTNIRIKIVLTLEDVLKGCDKKIRIKRYEKCTHCNGSGMTAESRKRTCKTCGGTGMAFSQHGFMSMQQTCPTCGGNGYVVENPCKHCNGHGIVQNPSAEVSFTIPKGVENGMQIEYAGLGNAAPHGKGVNGSLIVVIEVEKHKVFEQQGKDLVRNVDISAIDAILGCEVEIATLGGQKVKAKIPQGTSSGQTFRFKGYGLPIYGGAIGTNGSMIAVIRIITPKKLNDNERKLLEELKKEEHFK